MTIKGSNWFLQVLSQTLIRKIPKLDATFVVSNTEKVRVERRETHVLNSTLVSLDEVESVVHLLEIVVSKNGKWTTRSFPLCDKELLTTATYVTFNILSWKLKAIEDLPTSGVGWAS